MTQAETLPAVLTIVKLGTRAFPVSIAEIQLRVPVSQREVKAAVEVLRQRGEPIGAGRGRSHGYYYIRSAEDADAAVRPLVRQIAAMAKSVRSMVSQHRYRELMGQAVLEGGE